MLGKLDFCMLNPFCSTNVYGLATLNTPKEKILILSLGLPYVFPLFINLIYFSLYQHMFRVFYCSSSSAL